MADTVGQNLKTLFYSQNTSSTKERKYLFSSVVHMICDSEECSDAHLKLLARVFVSAIVQYNDSASALVVTESLHYALKAKGAKLLNPLVNEISIYAERLVGMRSSRSLATNALFVLGWLCHLLSSTADLEDGLRKAILTATAYTADFVYESGDRFLVRKARQKLKSLLNKQHALNDVILEQLTSAKEKQGFWLCLLGVVVESLTERRAASELDGRKGALLEIVVNVTLTSKQKPAAHWLTFVAPFLKYISHPEFKATVFPAIKKSLLRSPEICLDAVGLFLGNLGIDLSQYVEDIVKSLSAPLIGSQVALRESAVIVMSALARQCSDPDAVKLLNVKLLQVYGGSEGKLTSAEQKASVLHALLKTRTSGVSGKVPLEKIAVSLFDDHLAKMSEEVHEGTKLLILKLIASWASHFVSATPAGLMKFITNGLTAKMSSVNVRVAYLQLSLSAYKGNTLLAAAELIPLLQEAVSRAQSQPHQILIVQEGVCAAAMIGRLSRLDDITAKHSFQGVWKVVFEASNNVFTSDKFLTSGSKEGLQQLLALIEALFTQHVDVMQSKPDVRCWYRALLMMLLQPDNALRQHAKTIYARIVKSPSFSLSAVHDIMLAHFEDVVSRQLLSVNASSKEEDPPKASQNLHLVGIPSTLLAKTLLTICLTHDTSIDARYNQTLATKTLLLAHDPFIVAGSKNAWLKIVHSLGINVESLVHESRNELVKLFVDQTQMTKVHSNALDSLVFVSGSELLDLFMIEVMKELSKISLVQVTEEEYNIMTTPDGQLYDTSIIEKAKASVQKQSNVKRESKAYSFKEQKIEMELRAELMKKTDCEVVPKLTKQQQVAYDAQLEKEAEIRMRLKKVQGHLQKYMTIVEHLFRCPSFLAVVPSLIEVLISLLQSPLAAPVAAPVFVALGVPLFGGELHDLGAIVGHVTMRLCGAEAHVDPNWCRTDLATAVSHTVSMLHTCVTTRNVAFLRTYSRKTVFAPSVFAYCLPFLRKVLRDRGSLVQYNEEQRLKCLEIVSAHAKPDASNSEIFLLPRFEMMSLLSEVIVSADGYNKDVKIQHLACTCMVSLCHLANSDPRGDDGCSRELTLLADNLLSHCQALRCCSLQGIHCLLNVLPKSNTDAWMHLCRRVLMGKFDADEKTAAIAEQVWVEGHFDHAPAVCDLLLSDVMHLQEIVRTASAAAVEDVVAHHPILSSGVVYQLVESYDEKSKIVPPKMDSLGRVISAPYIDDWRARQGIALTLNKISKHLAADQVEEVFLFFVPKALGDCNEIVRKYMLQAALAVVEDHGKDNLTTFFNILEECLDSSPDSSAHDIIRQSVVILMGSCAKHLDKTDAKVKPILFRLMAALDTPSQQVQEAVSKCIAPLAPAIKEDVTGHVKELIHKLLESDSYGGRRGAAYGLAGLVKGLGIMSLKQQEIIPTLTEAIQNKKNARYREGALFAFETLCSLLGRLFEPYVVHLLPHLLLCFGDGNQYVREAADETAKAVMRNLSAHGVKLVLPSLLKALDEDSWRTKTGSVDLLGAMAFCAPKQLSSCLPSIVPRLTEVLADSHMKVQKAGQQALQQIGGVIRNPEILEISSIILDALADPASKTVVCLQALLSTSFVHFIDAPSLALIMPILERALKQRSTETKKMAAQILGNMYALTDHKDLAPYLPSVVPGLKLALLDPSPEVRAVSARALGAMVKGMGEERFGDLLPWLLETLTSEQSSVDRSGAAQGLAEVLYGLGTSRLDKLMPDVIETTSRVDLAPHIREGYLMLYVYLPSTFGDEFVAYIGSIIPSILQGLADEIEYVRDTSLKAGQRIINMYAESAVTLLLPQLECGLFDDNWRIRYSSMQLLGDLLFRISGVSGKMTTVGEEDDNFGTSHSMQAITDILGEARRNRVLAGLYMGRSDVALMVRQASLHIWKIVVQNTARTLRELLPTLFTLLLSNLASRVYDKRQIAARTLGDLVRKLGERVLPEIIPILEKGLESETSDERQGVCIGLSEIMESTSRDMVLQFETSLVSMVRRALCDPLPAVRLSAAKTFDRLHNIIGTRTLDGILADVLSKLDNPVVAEFALDGLRQVMAVKSKQVLPFLVPKLIAPPVNTKALAILSTVAGEALVKHLGKILPAMMGAIETAERSGADCEAPLEGTKALVLSVDDDLGVRIVVEELLLASKHQLPGMRKVAALLLFSFCQDTKAGYSASVPVLLRGIVTLLNDPDEAVVLEAWKTLDALIKRLDPSEQVAQIGTLRQSLRYIQTDMAGPYLPGFSIPKKGITPVLPMFREGILNGPPEIKELAATFLGEVIALTSVDALKPSVLHITGPLIRILGDRFNSNVKLAILTTLGRLLKKVGVTLKPFLPQLQTTFLKSLVDANSAVRQRAAWALNLLTVLHARVDQLFTELKNAINNNDDDDVRETVLQALQMVTRTVGAKMSEAVQKALYDVLLALLSSPTDAVREKAGAALGALCAILQSEELKTLLNNHLLDTNPSLDWSRRHGNTVALAHALFCSAERVMSVVDRKALVAVLGELANADKIPICIYGTYSLSHFALYLRGIGEKCPKPVAAAMRQPLQHTSSDVRVASLMAVSHLAQSPCDQPLDMALVEALMPDLIACVKDRNTFVRSTAEDCLYDVCGLKFGFDRVESFVASLPPDSVRSLMEICKIVNQKAENRIPDVYLFSAVLDFD